MSEMPAVARTLYEDWQARRRHVFEADSESSALRLLDYLLKRYAGAPEAVRPPRFPLRTHLLLNKRAMVVHAHLGQGSVAGVKTVEKSQTRIAGILSRMAAARPYEDLKAPADGAVMGMQDGLFSGLLALGNPVQSHSHAIAGALSSRNRRLICSSIDRALRNGEKLPARAMRYLLERIECGQADAGPAAGLLIRSPNESTLGFLIVAWRNRLAQSEEADSLTAMLEQAALDRLAQDGADRRLDRLRAHLADDVPVVRIRTARMLVRAGTLQDIGLLLDLLALTGDEGPNADERSVLEETVQALSQFAPPAPVR